MSRILITGGKGMLGRTLQKKLGGQALSIADLPDEINIELVDESEKTVGLGKINMSTGKVKLDCWFDMKGNLLKGKPTAKGIYFYNGKQVIVK